MVETITGCIVGGLISLFISHIYYKVSGKELEEYVKQLSTEIDNLKKISDELKYDTKLQLERQSKLDKGEHAELVEKQDGYGLKTSESMEGGITVRKKNNN